MNDKKAQYFITYYSCLKFHEYFQKFKCVITSMYSFPDYATRWGTSYDKIEKELYGMWLELYTLESSFSFQGGLKINT